MLSYKIAAHDQVDFLNFLIRNINSLKLNCSVIAQKGRLLNALRVYLIDGFYPRGQELSLGLLNPPLGHVFLINTLTLRVLRASTL